MSNNKIDTTPREVAVAIHERRLDGKSWAAVEHEFGMNKLTAAKLLTKHGLDHSPLDGQRRTPKEEQWARPCIRCKKPELRAKGFFRCKACREDGRSLMNASDSMYLGATIGGSHRRGGVAGGN